MPRITPVRLLNQIGTCMAIYSRIIFPRLCDWVMHDSRMPKLRREALAEVSGEALEIGFGTGLNLPHYPEHVRRITTVDPNPGMSRIAQRRLPEAGTPAQGHPAPAPGGCTVDRPRPGLGPPGSRTAWGFCYDRTMG